MGCFSFSLVCNHVLWDCIMWCCVIQDSSGQSHNIWCDIGFLWPIISHLMWYNIALSNHRRGIPWGIPNSKWPPTVCCYWNYSQFTIKFNLVYNKTVISISIRGYCVVYTQQLYFMDTLLQPPLEMPLIVSCYYLVLKFNFKKNISWQSAFSHALNAGNCKATKLQSTKI